MAKFEIVENKRESLVRSIRIKKDMHEKLCLICKSTGVSYNGLVVKCIEFAIDNI